jgi:hypothetical protein
MTENKLRKFISKPREPPSGKITHQPIILTDSKGNSVFDRVNWCFQECYFGAWVSVDNFYNFIIIRYNFINFFVVRHPSRQPAIKNLVKTNIRTGQKRLLGKYQ